MTLSQEREQKPQVQSAAIQAKFKQGMALHQQGKLADAEDIYREVLRQQPDHTNALHMLGVISLQTRHPEEAIAYYDKVVALKPNLAEAYNNRGNALRDLRRSAEALASYDRAIALAPDLAMAHYNRGNAQSDLRRSTEALASYERAIALKPDLAIAYNSRGSAFLDLGRPEEARASFERAIVLVPDYAEAYSNRGIALSELNCPEEALASCDTAIALKPNFAEAYNNRGNALLHLKRAEDALASYDKAIALKPDFAEAYWHQSHCFLLLGRFEQGWRQFEWRKRRSKPIAARSFPQPLWLGEEDISGKTLFIWWEQGLGDTIQFCRYAKLVEARGATVILSVQKPLLRLLEQISPTIEVINEDDVPADFDYHCPLMSLPLAFKTSLSTIPADIPYLKSSVEKSLFWKKKLGGENKPRVGLVWSGGFRPNQPVTWSVHKRKSIPLTTLAVLKDPDIEFFSLQKGQPAESELAELTRNKWNGPDIIDFTSLQNDFSDTAALVENLDLVISVDTSTAHLAGALGKRVWILNCFEADWRWLRNKTDSPWYPTATLYRQEKAGDWDGVVQRVKADLACFHGRL